MVRGRMADVLRVTFAALAAVKAIDVASDHGVVWAIGWVLVCTAAAVHRFGCAALAVAAAVGWALADENMQSTHAVLIGWVALILATTEGPDRVRLLRTQVTALYLFAALNKINADFLRGEAIALRVDELPFGLPFTVAAAGAVFVEGWLAWAVYRHHRFALPVAVVLHASIVAMMGTRPYEWVMLTAYNGLVVLLVWTLGRSLHDHRQGAIRGGAVVEEPCAVGDPVVPPLVGVGRPRR